MEEEREMGVIWGKFRKNMRGGKNLPNDGVCVDCRAASLSHIKKDSMDNVQQAHLLAGAFF